MHKLSSRRPGSSRVLARFFGLILFAVPLSAGAADLGFKVEPGVAIPLTLASGPQQARLRLP